MILHDALPGIKAFFAGVPKLAHALMLIRLVAAFLEHPGRMSASAAAGRIRTHARHRAAVVRFLGHQRWSADLALLESLAERVLAFEATTGRWLLLVDQTYVGQQGQKTENTFSRANSRSRPKKGQRRQKKYAKRSCHGFVFGLLITPSGIRVPLLRSYLTKDYVQARGQTYRKQTELAAELIATAPVPPGAEVVVLGDTAFDAKCIRVACGKRGWSWIVPANPERVLAGPKGQRPKLTSLIQELSADGLQAIRLHPAKGRYVAQRRVSRCRVGPKLKARTYYVQRERREVHSVGRVQLVFSTREKPAAGKAVRVQKLLMTNGLRLGVREVVELYELRWQIELFFKELKSTLGMDRYRFRQFGKVENWVQVCLLAFLYLEWTRARQLRRRSLSEAERRWLLSQRCHGLAQAACQRAEEHDLEKLWQWSGSRTGRKKLRQALRAARPPEYRQAA